MILRNDLEGVNKDKVVDGISKGSDILIDGKLLPKYCFQQPGEIYLQIIGKSETKERLIVALEDILLQLKSRKQLEGCYNQSLKCYIKK